MSNTRPPRTRSLALKATRGNVTYSSTGPMAWYVLDPVRWSFRDSASREAVVTAAAAHYAALAGRRLHLRITARPWSAEWWRAEMAADAVNPLPGYGAYLDSEADHLATLSLTTKLVYLGVSLARPVMALGVYDKAPLAAETAEVDSAVDGIGGRPATPAELEYLLRRSILLGCAPMPERAAPREDWTAEDIPELEDLVYVDTDPYGPVVRLTPNHLDAEPPPTPSATWVAEARRAGWKPPAVGTRYVSVLTMGRSADLPPEVPWLERTAKLGFPVEVSVTAHILHAHQIAKFVADALGRVKYQREHITEFGLPVPLSLPRAEAKAVVMGDEAERGLTGAATRARIWVHWLVAADSEAECIDRCRRLRDLYGPAVTVARPADQYRLTGEFIPGEPQSTPAYRHTAKVSTVAGANPAVDRTVGHPVGLRLGNTSDGAARSATLWALHHSMEKANRPGLTLVAAQPGAGKSTTLAVVINGAVLSGVRTVAYDPSGPLARLTKLPELYAHARHIDLMAARPGILNPFRIIPDPRREHYDTDEYADPERAWKQALVMAEHERRQLCQDVLTMFLPAQIAERTDTYRAILAATRTVGGHRLYNPRMVLGALESQGSGPGKELAEVLDDISHLPAAQLVFPWHRPNGPQPGDEAADDDAGFDEALLTVVTMADLAVPPDRDPKLWTAAERNSIPVMHLAAHYTRRVLYAGDRNERKLLVMDEGHAITAVASGKQLVRTSGRDSRKHNTRVIIASQSMSDLTVANLGGLVDSAFQGHTSDPTDAADGLEVCRVPVGVGYEEVLAALPTGPGQPREMLFYDGTRTEVITIDLTGLAPHVRTAIDTTPAPARMPAPPSEADVANWAARAS